MSPVHINYTVKQFHVKCNLQDNWYFFIFGHLLFKQLRLNCLTSNWPKNNNQAGNIARTCQSKFFKTKFQIFKL